MVLGLAIRREFLAQRSDPERLWVRFTPKGWPLRDGWMTDLRTAADPGRARASTRDSSVPEPGHLEALDDLLWLPAVEPTERSRRDRWIERAVEAGVPVLVQHSATEAIEPRAGVVPMLDLFETLASGDLDALPTTTGPATTEPGVVVWPLVAGWTDQAACVSEGLGALKARGFRTVVGVRVELTPIELRELADRVPPEGYERLFHAPPADRQEFARSVDGAGLDPFFERPLPAEPALLRRNRRLAAGLFRTGELWLAVERDELVGQAFFRAARWVDESPKDIEALALEGNLGIVEWLEPPIDGVIDELARNRDSTLLAELREEYLHGRSEG